MQVFFYVYSLAFYTYQLHTKTVKKNHGSLNTALYSLVIIDEEDMILLVMELQPESLPWVQVALATFPPITVRVRMEGLVGISLGLPFGILHVLLKL